MEKVREKLGERCLDQERDKFIHGCRSINQVKMKWGMKVGFVEREEMDEDTCFGDNCNLIIRFKTHTFLLLISRFWCLP